MKIFFTPSNVINNQPIYQTYLTQNLFQTPYPINQPQPINTYVSQYYPQYFYWYSSPNFFPNQIQMKLNEKDKTKDTFSNQASTSEEEDGNSVPPTNASTINFSIVKKEFKKYFKCEHRNCNKLYKSKENLILHYRNKHLSQKPYKCNYCEAAFSHRNGKTYHERKVHTMDFPHKCEIPGCEMKFASKSALSYHKKHQH